MKRSYINQLVSEALQFFDAMNFKLPPWGYWSLDDWKMKGMNCKEVVENQLGWDLTDFGSGDFHELGLLLFTIRGGNPIRVTKPYAEKIMIIEEDQVTPMHFHHLKMEDIVNRGGGNLLIQLYLSDENEELSDREFDVSIDGVKRLCKPGDTVRLQPGESITLYPGLYHEFYAETGKGKVLAGEVSTINNDHKDNRFHFEVGRFPRINEDDPPQHLLINDYKNFLEF